MPPTPLLLSPTRSPTLAFPGSLWRLCSLVYKTFYDEELKNFAGGMALILENVSIQVAFTEQPVSWLGFRYTDKHNR